MDRGVDVVNNCHHYPLRPFISQGLQVSEVICCFIVVGGNNFNLVLEDKKDISIFWYTWSYLQVSVNVQKCLKWKWLQNKLGILSLNFSDRVLQNTMPHTVAKSNISDIHLYFFKFIYLTFILLQNKRNIFDDVQSEDQCLNLGTFLPFFPSSRHCNIFVLKSYVGSIGKNKTPFCKFVLFFFHQELTLVIRSSLRPLKTSFFWSEL